MSYNKLWSRIHHVSHNILNVLYQSLIKSVKILFLFAHFEDVWRKKKGSCSIGGRWRGGTVVLRYLRCAISPCMLLQMLGTNSDI